MLRKVIAVDFDGTLCENNYPEIGDVGPRHIAVHEYIKQEHENGTIIILWTCRCGKELDAAVNFCKKHDIPIDYVNENDPERVRLYGSDSRKVSADVYIDDKALGFSFTNVAKALLKMPPTPITTNKSDLLRQRINGMWNMYKKNHSQETMDRIEELECELAIELENAEKEKQEWKASNEDRKGW